MILISSCLMGKNCRYDGDNCQQLDLIELFEEEEILDVCPELEGGLSIPRSPAEIFGGDGYDVLEGRAEVVSADGREITGSYLIGIRNILSSIDLMSVEMAILKSLSPACGPGQIYSGEFEGKLKNGDGVLAAFLKRAEIPVFSEEDIDEIKNHLKKRRLK